MEQLPKALKVVAIVCGVIIVLEFLIMGIQYLIRENNTVYSDAYQTIDMNEEYMVAVGGSDFKHSQNYDYTGGVERAKVGIYDHEGSMIRELRYEEGYDSTFYSVKLVEDGFIAVGGCAFTEYQRDNNIRTGIVVKYDFDGNIVWQQKYDVLSDTEFFEIVLLDDGFVVVGQSIYENLELGNHTTGGGIIVKYDYDGNVIWFNNYGGNKSGRFNDVAVTDTGIVTVGKDSKDTGTIVFFNFNGEREWVRNYSYTDSEGFQGVAVFNHQIYAVGSSKVWTDTGDSELDDQRATTNTQGLIACYDTTGKMLFEKNYGGSNYERFEDVIVDGENLYLVGHTTSHDLEIETFKEDADIMTGWLVKTDLNGEMLKQLIFGGTKDDNLLSIKKNGDHFIVVGFSKSNNGDLKGIGMNGKDFMPVLFHMNSELEIANISKK